LLDHRYASQQKNLAQREALKPNPQIQFYRGFMLLIASGSRSSNSLARSAANPPR
jgi:hypothetical protein